MEVYRIHIAKKHWPEPFYMQRPDNGKKNPDRITSKLSL
jgi:hypothetical protein